jgi:hypothetical protein
MNVRLTVDAWAAFNKGAWEMAAAKAGKCIREFGAQALRDQVQLEKAKVPKPPIGAVSESDKNGILRRGLLNDVGTCLFIKARALHELGRNDEATRFYQAATKLTYARCYDPSWNGLWSPAEAAADRLAESGLPQ